jgi:hypothetical protein
MNRTFCKSERKIPLIPTTENINKIIAKHQKNTQQYSILLETGLERYELATIH